MGTFSLLVKLCAVSLLINGVKAIDMELLDSFMTYQTDQLCELATCIHPAGNWCPDGTRWVEGITVGGCCGGCVRFKQGQEAYCTGKSDSLVCIDGGNIVTSPGYGYCTPSSRSGRSSANNVNLVKSLSNTRTIEDGVEVYTSGWCDYGLVCSDAYVPNMPVCVKNSGILTCKDTQDAYDSDKANGNYEVYRDDYRWRPDCDEDNSYSPKQCKTSFQDSVKQCTCVDPKGGSLPGKAFDFEEELYDEMNCLCSRKQYELLLDGVSGVTMHCKSNGNYEELQCQDGFCYCVHSLNGTIYGYQMPESGLNYLPCYNRTQVGELYFRFCDSQEYAHNTLVSVMDKKGVRIGPAPPVNCNYDGSYAGYQCVGSKCSCGNKYNQDCNVNGIYGCGCYNDMLTYAENGKNYGSLVCGNYQGVYNQTQYIYGYSAQYMVDQKDGVRITPVVRAQCVISLSNSLNCQTYGNDATLNYCNQTCPDCVTQSYFYNEAYFPSAECADVTENS